MDTEEVEAGDLAEGGLVVVDGEPCAITSIERTQPGKHGTAKVTVDAEGLSDGGEQRLVQPADAAVEVPVFESVRNPVIMVGGGGHFDPLGVRVSAGSNVVWLWDDDEPHRVVAEDGSFASDREAGEGYTFERTFDDPGVHLYACEEHEGRGAVVVE